MHVESNKTKTLRPLLLCMINTPHGLSEYTNIWVHPIKTFLWQHILRIPFFYIRPKNRLHFYTPCQVLVINLDKTSSMAKFSWSFVRWAMLQTVNWVILPNGMMQNTLQLIMPQVCHITCSAILPALTLGLAVFFSFRTFAYLFTFSFHVIIIFIAFTLLPLSTSTLFCFLFSFKMNSF